MNLVSLIVDDESQGRATLHSLLRSIGSDSIGSVFEASNVAVAYDVLATHAPDLVFLDIELGSDNGLEFLEQWVLPRDFSVVIVTGHEKYGIGAARCGVLDYLIKPVDPDELFVAIQKAERETIQGRLLRGIQPDLHDKFVVHLPVPTARGHTTFLAASDIVACCARGYYCNFYCIDNREVLASRQLKEYEALLVQAGFIRISRSAFVNPSYVQRCGSTAVSAWVEMPNALILPVARRRKKEALARLIR